MSGSWRSLLGGLVLGLGLAGCGSSAASLPFAEGTPTVADAADLTPYPDSTPPVADAGTAQDVATADAPSVPKCPVGKDGKGNVCVRVLRDKDAPSLNEASKALGLDGTGAIVVGLAAIKPGKEISFVAKTWYPGVSSGAAKFDVGDLPKLAEPLSVAPGKYYVFAIFRDQEPYDRSGLAVGDYIPRISELPIVEIGANEGKTVDLMLYALRAFDVEVKLGVPPVGSGSGPLRAWFTDASDDTKTLGEGWIPCADLSGGRTESVRIFTTYGGEDKVLVKFNVALFDFAGGTDDPTAGGGPVPAGSVVNSGSALEAVLFEKGVYLVPVKKRVDLDKIIAFPGKPPSDPSPSCVGYSYAPPK